jgi:hypothetical protein
MKKVIILTRHEYTNWGLPWVEFYIEYVNGKVRRIEVRGECKGINEGDTVIVSHPLWLDWEIRKINNGR